jgi:hypothetical protein
MRLSACEQATFWQNQVAIQEHSVDVDVGTGDCGAKGKECTGALAGSYFTPTARIRGK